MDVILLYVNYSICQGYILVVKSSVDVSLTLLTTGQWNTESVLPPDYQENNLRFFKLSKKYGRKLTNIMKKTTYFLASILCILKGKLLILRELKCKHVCMKKRFKNIKHKQKCFTIIKIPFLHSLLTYATTFMVKYDNYVLIGNTFNGRHFDYF